MKTRFTDITTPSFMEELYYATDGGCSGTPRYNGNVSVQKWSNGDGLNSSPYAYDANGSLVADRSRGIAYVTYGADNNPGKVYFTNGSVTKYVYGASGEKLRVAHYTAKPNITRTFGVQPPELTRSQILCADSTDYLLGGSLVLTNGVMDKVLFDGGYAKATAEGSGSYTFAFYYYNRDHLGNNREVVTKRGAIHQVTNYYPFGAPFTETAPVVSPDLQPYKYNGKELDRMHGLDTYDYGARQYYPILGRWDRMDPLCEKYYDVSPYAYCGNNPIKFIDPDGRKPGDVFASVDDAAVNFGRIYNYHSIVDKGEYAGVLFRFINQDGNYSYTYAVSGKQSPSSCKYNIVDGSVLPQDVRLEMVGTIHAHANYDDIEGNPLCHEGNEFSKEDIKANKIFHDDNPSMTDFYVCTTNGNLLKHWYNKDENKWYNIKFNADEYKLPSDPNDPSHNEYTIDAINAKVPFWTIRPLMDFDAYLENQEYK